MTLVKHVQIFSSFKQAYYYTLIIYYKCLRDFMSLVKHVKCYYKGCCCIVFRDFMSLVKHDQILSSFNQAYYCTNYRVFSVVRMLL